MKYQTLFILIIFIEKRLAMSIAIGKYAKLTFIINKGFEQIRKKLAQI